MADSRPGQKISPPTPHRLRELRRKGQWYSSRDLAGAVLFATLAIIWSQGIVPASGQLLSLIGSTWQPERLGDQDPFHGLGEVLKLAENTLLILVVPLLIILFVMAALAMAIQVGPLFSLHPLSPSADRLNPAQGLRRMFLEARTWRNGVLGVVKLSFVSVVTAMTVWASAPNLILAIRLKAASTSRLFEGILTGFLWKAGALYLLFGLVDYFIQRASFMKQHRMTREELIEDAREEERSPESQQRISANRAAMLKRGRQSVSG